VAEYERTLIAERTRRGRQARLWAGTLVPWTRVPFGYRLDPERPGEVAGVRVAPDEAVLVAQLFDWYPQPQATLYRLAKRILRTSPKRKEEAYELHNVGPAVRGSRCGSPPERVPLAR
jgi:site-specific DNA recombinase